MADDFDENEARRAIGAGMQDRLGRVAALEEELIEARRRISELESQARGAVHQTFSAQHAARASVDEQRRRNIQLVHDSRTAGRFFRRLIIAESYRIALELGPVPEGAELVVRVPSGFNVGTLASKLRGFSFAVMEHAPLEENAGAWLAVAPAPAASPRSDDDNGGPPPRRAA